MLDKTIEIIEKVDKWWIKEIEIPTNPDFDDMDYDEIKWDEVLSGNMILISFLSSIYDGDDTFLRLFHKEFVEKWKKLKG